MSELEKDIESSEEAISQYSQRHLIKLIDDSISNIVVLDNEANSNEVT